MFSDYSEQNKLTFFVYISNKSNVPSAQVQSFCYPDILCDANLQTHQIPVGTQTVFGANNNYRLKFFGSGGGSFTLDMSTIMALANVLRIAGPASPAAGVPNMSPAFPDGVQWPMTIAPSGAKDVLITLHPMVNPNAKPSAGNSTLAAVSLSPATGTSSAAPSPCTSFSVGAYTVHICPH